ncbi:SDR family oxidoreductase [Shewanella sp. CG12_big_fil_rev_8_21_14_0_65_47_15]|uniref:SDR family oxidoreductase n=1 Tax=Shewanella sp. CG12_big_fil_rev_8_21_14_0_65_47_15 TaxID=1975537 RepID=UPI000CC45B1A|nr:SDR family oxidoreductase [Shewanella sp. CG12_big_fil_rev_8_21_14_0_65_47_15]PIW60493.1 MAG: short-chain dehydrogenase [Shewanella sp. CG12_big_fil_rev_8_21_14_0_65_47_15]
MNRFVDKTVLVTGGNSGIGLATAIQYAKEGARVVITGRDQATLEQAKVLIGANTIALKNDQGNIHAAAQLADMLGQQGIKLDAIFINAGVAKFAPFQDVDEALWDQTFNVNVKGAYFTIQALTPLLNRGAAIVLNGSINAHIGMPTSSVYAASKAALISFAKTLSAELLPLGVRVNVVSPGPVSTPLYGRLGMDSAQLEQMAKSIQEQIPLNRFGTSEELASTVLFMSSADSAFIVGTELIADGGMSQL